MADPRADVRFDNIDYRTETFKIDNSTITYSATEDNGSAQVGLAVTQSAGDTVELVGDGEAVLGKLISVTKDNYCTVQTRGYCTLPGGTSATLTILTKIVGDLLVSAEGYIQSASTQHTLSRGRIVDPTATTAVVVYLE